MQLSFGGKHLVENFVLMQFIFGGNNLEGKYMLMQHVLEGKIGGKMIEAIF